MSDASTVTVGANSAGAKSEEGPTELTRQSWNVATRIHNSHKGDQARMLRDGGDVLFAEELSLLGPLAGKRLAHLQCNAGQDSLCLARRGAVVTGIDISDEAITFAKGLSSETGIAATFVRSELLIWLHNTSERFDIAFSSYGAVGWIADLGAWAAGIERVLAPGGRFVYVEFHPQVWSLEGDRIGKDDYFEKKPFVEPVGDYVAESGAGLGAVDATAGGGANSVDATAGGGANSVDATNAPNTIAATSYQHTLGSIVTALARAGLRLETLEEYPYSNGCKVNTALELDADRRWQFPAGKARVPMMFGVVFSKAR